MSPSDGRRPVARTRSVHWFGRTSGLTAVVCAGWLAFAACSSSEEQGLELTVMLAVSPAMAQDGVLELETDLGYAVTLERAYITLGAVEIFDCDATGAGALLKRWFEPTTAFAHSTSSPTRLGAPFVASLLASGQGSREIGVLLPPPGNYCSTQVELAPADEDAQGLPDDVNMVGATLDVRGRWSDGGDSTGDFALHSAATSERSLTIALRLSGDRRKQTLTLEAALDHAFDGVDFAEQSESEQAKAVLSNISQGLQADPR